MRPLPERVDALVLAGGINHIALFEGCTAGYKALLPFDGKPAIRYTLDALTGAPQVGRMCIVGSEADLREAVAPVADAGHTVEFAPGGDTLIGSVMAGLQHFAGSPAVLIATADIPLVTAAIVTDFLCACSRVETPYENAFLLSVVPAERFAGPWAATTKGFSRFRDVTVCHGSLMLADPRLLQNREAMARIECLYGNRKSEIRSAMAVGCRVGLSYIMGVRLLHLLTMDQMARFASWRFNVGLVPVPLKHPEVALDVDEPADYTFVTQQLARRAAEAAACG